MKKMEQTMFLKLEVESIESIETRYVMSSQTEFTIKVGMNRHHLAKMLLLALEDCDVNHLNEVFNRYGLDVKFNENGF